MNDSLLIDEPLNESSGFHIASPHKLGEWRARAHRVELYDTAPYGRLMRLDGRNLTSEQEEFFCHENLVHPALTAHAAPRRVLVIGGADGGSAEEALKHPSVGEVVLCEADAEIVALARQHLGAVHRGAFDDARLRLVPGEARAYLREAHERFDLIALDALDRGARAETLLAAEFLQLCRQMLAPGGALALQLGAPVARPAQVAEIAQRLNGLFRIVRPYAVFVPLYGTLWAFAVCSDKLDPKSFTADEIDRRIETRRIGALRYYNGETHEGVFALPNFIRDLVNPPRVKLQARGRRLGVVEAAVK